MVAQREVFRIDVVGVGEKSRPEILRFLADVTHAEYQVLSQLILQLKAPVAGHGRPTLFRQDHFATYSAERTVSIRGSELCRIQIGSKAGRRISAVKEESRTEARRGSRTCEIAADTAAYGETLSHRRAEVVVLERTVDNRAASAKHGFSAGSRKNIGKADPRSDVLEPRVRPGCVAIAV